MSTNTTLPEVGSAWRRFEGNVYAVVLSAEAETTDSPARVTVTTVFAKPFGMEPNVTRQCLDAFLLDFKPLDTEFLTA
jgi:hypothetical protein